MTPKTAFSAHPDFREEAHPNCVVCSPKSESGLRLEFDTSEDGSVQTSFGCDGKYEGFPGVLHGGVIASLLDGAMTNCLFSHGYTGLTGELKVRFRYPVATGQTSRIRAWIEMSETPFHLLKAELIQDRQIKARATGKFMEQVTSSRRCKKSPRPSPRKHQDADPAKSTAPKKQPRKCQSVSEASHDFKHELRVNTDLQITVLAENTARGVDLLGEHGLAFWIETDGHSILFDTGQGKVLHHNAQCLEVPLPAAESVVLSHGHFDHTGGLKHVLDTAGQVDLYLHPAALEEKYHREKTPPHRGIGIPGLNERALRDRTKSLTWTTEPTTVIEGVHLTGEIPRRNDFEDTGGPFYLDESCTETDPLLDDQAMYIETPVGAVVVLGCAHAGVVNTLDYVAELTGRDSIHAVLGGMHLMQATPRRLEATVAALKRYGVRKIGTAHCTGTRATSYLWSQFPDECFECCVGTVFQLE